MNPPPPPPRPRPHAAPPPPNRAAAVFHSALACPAEERAAFLESACDRDALLLAEAQALLAAHAAAGDFMQADAPLPPEVVAELARLKPEEAGERIGPYKLLEQIGVGGFGVVWMAEQEQPVRRRVALKILKLGMMDSKEVIARFEQERQARAMMDHANIAKVFDAGATQWGRPFFVMELVRGVKITDYCNEQQLSTEQRLGLFIRVCQAVQHAHQKGIIHRDVKPSNILVTVNDGEAVPKVIDFGVAKATQGRLTDGTLFTEFEQDEPVSATPPSAIYQFRKFAQRNRAALGVAAVIAAVLVAATLVSTWLAVRAMRAEKRTAAERDAKELARQDAEAILNFLCVVFQSPDPARNGRTITVAETLDTAAKKLDTDLANQPYRRAKLQWTLGDTYSALGLNRQALSLREKVQDYCLATSGAEHPDTLRATQNLANSRAVAG